MKNYKTGFLKFAIGWAVVFVVRLLPFRPANVEPLMATAMPFSKGYGSVVGFVFAAASIVVFDAFTSGIGLWTFVTALSYGVVIALVPVLISGKSSSINYAATAFALTVIYDALTGLTIGPIMFGQSFLEAFVGQIPFTFWHLVGNTAFSFVLSSALERWVVQEEKLETRAFATKSFSF